MSTYLDAPVVELALEALAWGLEYRINPQDGYYFNMDKGEVNFMSKTQAERKAFPSIDIITDVSRMTNNIQGGNSYGGFNHILPVLLECHLKATDDAWRYPLRMRADLEKFFGTYHNLPDKQGNATIFNSVIESSRPFGMESNVPDIGLDMRVILYFRTEQANPRQSF